jgi:hypothetical protein
MKMILLHKIKTGHDVDEWVILRAPRECERLSGLHKLRNSALVLSTLVLMVDVKDLIVMWTNS